MEGVNEASSPDASNNVDITKAFAKRLSEVREKDRTELAAALGFASWDEALNSGLDKKLVDAGIDPTAGKPIIENMVEVHPDVIKAKQLLAEAEKSKQEADLALLNNKYGLNIASVSQLDEATKNLISKGMTVSQAYAAIHIDELLKPVDTISVAKQQQSASLNHLSSIPGAASSSEKVIPISQQDISAVRKFMPNASEEDIKKFLEKHKEYKK